MELGVCQGDNTGALGQTALLITVDNPNGYYIKSLELRVGDVIKTVEVGMADVSYQWSINFTEEETSRLSVFNNTAYLAFYDIQGRKRTANGSISFNLESRRV